MIQTGSVCVCVCVCARARAFVTACHLNSSIVSFYRILRYFTQNMYHPQRRAFEFPTTNNKKRHVWIAKLSVSRATRAT